MTLLSPSGSFGLTALTDSVTLSLSNTQRSLGRDMQDLSTGLRVNSPADAPAEYVIARKMDTAIRSYDSASQGLQNASNYLNVASGDRRECN